MGLTRSEAIDAAACIVAGTCFPDPDPESELTNGFHLVCSCPFTSSGSLYQLLQLWGGGGGWAGAVEGMGGRLQTSTSPPFRLPHSKDSCSASFMAALVQDLKGMSVLPPS